MSDMNREIALKFCGAANWAFEAWMTRRWLFDDNDRADELFADCSAFTDRLSMIAQEYAMQQLAKLHDPAQMRNSWNLSIAYMVEFGGWQGEQGRIEALAAELGRFFDQLKTARNKLLAHNDRDMMLQDVPLGAFQDGDDAKYFATLQEFVNLVHDKWGNGGPFPFNDLAQQDVVEFLACVRPIERIRE